MKDCMCMNHNLDLLCIAARTSHSLWVAPFLSSTRRSLSHTCKGNLVEGPHDRRNLNSENGWGLVCEGKQLWGRGKDIRLGGGGASPKVEGITHGIPRLGNWGKMWPNALITGVKCRGLYLPCGVGGAGELSGTPQPWGAGLVQGSEHEIGSNLGTFLAYRAPVSRMTVDPHGCTKGLSCRDAGCTAVWGQRSW